MAIKHPFYLYSSQVLSFQWLNQQDTIIPEPPLPENRQKNLASVLKRREKSQKSHVLLLGLGAGSLARDLAKALPPSASLIVADLLPEHVQAFMAQQPDMLDWRTAHGRHQVLTDASSWAMALLIIIAGATHANTIVLLNPELNTQRERDQYKLLQRVFVSTSVRAAPHLSALYEPPTLSAAAILHPDEPNLETFFSQFPSWLHELVVVWDCDTIPLQNFVLPTKIKQFARPLKLDFAAQRNAMLNACSGQWVLYLDGDERLEPATWHAVPKMLGDKEVNGYYFTRQTLFPDTTHCMAGLGMWPDLQLRLFRNQVGVHFERPVHERLRGLDGAVGILFNTPILHESHLQKNTAQWEKKLDLFNRAAQTPGQEVSPAALKHRLNRDYPYLERSLFSKLAQGFALPTSLVLPHNPEK